MIDGSDGLFLLIQTPLTCIHVKYQLYIVLKILIVAPCSPSWKTWKGCHEKKKL